MLTTDSSQPKIRSPRWLLLLPFGLLAVLLVTSPNFQWTPEMRSAPYGGDFLQEWVGGRIVRSHDREKLYDPQLADQLQHDPKVVGFEWPAKNYFPMVYPPYYYFLVSPFSELDYRWATLIWAGLMAGAMSLTGYLLFRFYPPCRNVFSVWFVLAVIFVPWIKCLSMGQKSSVLLLWFTGTFLLLRGQTKNGLGKESGSSRPFRAGMVFGLMAIKPQLGLVIGVAMLLQRRWSFVAGAAVTVAALVGVSWMISPELWKDYLAVVTGMGDYVRTGGYQPAESHSLWGAAQLTFSALGQTAVKWIAGGLSIAMVIGLVIAFRRKSLTVSPANIDDTATDNERSERTFALQYAALMGATVLLSPHFYTYDLTILLLPMLIVFAEIGFRPHHTGTQFILGLTLLLYGLAGSFPAIAAAIHFQPSVLIIGGLCFGLLNLANGREESVKT